LLHLFLPFYLLGPALQPTVNAQLEQISREHFMSAALTGIELCVFDAYGTLFDFNSAVARHRAAIGPKADALADLWRAKQIQYTWLRNSMGAYAKFWQVTGEALDHCLAACPIADAAVRDKLMGAYLALDAFPEVPAMLDALKRAGKRLAILSNGNPEMLEPMVAACKLADRFEAVLSVDAAGVFKPDPRVYRLVEARCGVKPDKVCFLSSNCWDAHGAAHFGFPTVWVNRTGIPNDNLPGKLVAEIPDLSRLPSLLGVS
jgi:2-haloacid dehalogenase